MNSHFYSCFGKINCRFTILLFFLFLGVDQAFGQRVIGNLEVHDLNSAVFQNTRSIRVWLPPEYNDPASKDTVYPTLYLNDGQNLFDADTSLFGEHEWRVDEVADLLIKLGKIPPIVIVGIDNAGRRDRAREYLPFPDEHLEPPEPDPQGVRYPKFLKEEVIPFIEERYRVSKTNKDRVLGGSSYGALISAYVAVDNPEIFSGLLLESPSFYVDDNRILKLVDASKLALTRVYLGVGTNELALDGCPDHPGNQEAVDGVNQMAEILRSKGLEDGRSLFVKVEKCAEHTESAWAGRLPDALLFLFDGEVRTGTPTTLPQGNLFESVELDYKFGAH